MGPSDYAMGWVLGKEVGHPFVWHNGETYAYTASNGMFLDDGFSVALLTNGAVNEDTPFLNLGEQIIQGDLHIGRHGEELLSDTMD